MSRSFWFSVLAYLLPTFVLGYVWHLVAFADYYHRLAMYGSILVSISRRWPSPFIYVLLRAPTRPGQGQPCLFLCGFSMASYELRLNVLPQTVHANVYVKPKLLEAGLARPLFGVRAPLERLKSDDVAAERARSIGGAFIGPEAASSMR